LGETIWGKIYKRNNETHHGQKKGKGGVENRGKLSKKRNVKKESPWVKKKRKKKTRYVREKEKAAKGEKRKMIRSTKKQVGGNVRINRRGRKQGTAGFVVGRLLRDKSPGKD